MGPSACSKKIGFFRAGSRLIVAGQIDVKMVRIGLMARPMFPLDRREWMAGLGAVALTPFSTAAGRAQGRPSLALRASVGNFTLRPGGPPTAIWSLMGPANELRFKRGDSLEIAIENELPTALALNWRGIDGAAEAEPLTARLPAAMGSRDTYRLPLRHAGTILCDLSLAANGDDRPTHALPFRVTESEEVVVDRDELFLIEDWRLRPDGTAMAPGADPKDAKPSYTVNGLASLDVTARHNDRLRIRFINSCQRSIIAIKIENLDVRVMAIDSQPAEPFQARNGAVVLAPGSRVDVFVDVTATVGTTSSILVHDGKEALIIGKLIVSKEPPIRTALLPPAPPLPSNGLPAQLDLKGATRADLTLAGTAGDWVTTANFAATAKPAFRAKAGRTVVLALANRAAIATVFHLHGHHFRLLDRLDDGWKPFWLDTLAIEPGQTQRIAFAAEYRGRWLMESVTTDWAASRLVRWYGVE